MFGAVFGAPFPPRRVTRFLDFTGFLRDYFLIGVDFIGHHKKSWKIKKSHKNVLCKMTSGRIITREEVFESVTPGLKAFDYPQTHTWFPHGLLVPYRDG